MILILIKEIQTYINVFRVIKPEELQEKYLLNAYGESSL